MSWVGLEEVVAIADAGTFTRAAASIGVSTSQISRAVARLEDQLSTKLFHRTTRKVVLTDTGRAFVDQCRRLLQERDELFAQVSGSSEPQGDLRITCSITLGERFVAPIVQRFAEEHPRVSVMLDLTNRLVDLVGEGYDIGIRTGQVADIRLAGRQIASRSIEVSASPLYLERAGVPTSIDELKNHQCLVGTTTTWHFLDAAIPLSFTPRGRWRCNNGSATVDAAIAGMGICQLPAFYVRGPIDEGRLQPILEHFRAEPEPVWAVYPQRRHFLPKVRKLVDALEQRLPDAINAS